jgi:nitroreductase
MLRITDIFSNKNSDFHLNENLRKAIKKSQHCQRNWALDQKIPDEHLSTFEVAITECPSKQNLSFYSAYFITNRDLIEEIHKATKGFVLSADSDEHLTNPQTLANLLVVFVKNPAIISESSYGSNPQVHHENLKIVKKELLSKESENENLNKDRLIALGIAAGYLNLTANMLGYSTGCCSCFEGAKIKNLLNEENDILLLMGIGHKDPSRSRLEHHTDPKILFPTLKKQKVNVINKK